MLRSIAAVIGSYVLSILLVLATDPLISRVFPGDFVRGHIPSTKPLIASTALFVIVSIFCAWLCARVSPRQPGRHVLYFFLLGEVIGIAMTIPNWSHGWPKWYWLAWLLSWPVSCWIGLMLAPRRATSKAAGA